MAASASSCASDTPYGVTILSHVAVRGWEGEANVGDATSASLVVSGGGSERRSCASAAQTPFRAALNEAMKEKQLKREKENGTRTRVVRAFMLIKKKKGQVRCVYACARIVGVTTETAAQTTTTTTKKKAKPEKQIQKGGGRRTTTIKKKRQQLTV